MFKKLVILILFIFLFLPSNAQETETDVHEIHAMFIINFIKYIEFPIKSNISIGVIQNIEVYKSFKTKIGSSNMVIKNIFNLNDVENYGILYLPSNNNHLIYQILGKIKGKKILLITELPNNTYKGASISFKVINDKMKFQMNKPLMESMGYKIYDSLYDLSVK